MSDPLELKLKQWRDGTAALAPRPEFMARLRTRLHEQAKAPPAKPLPEAFWLGVAMVLLGAALAAAMAHDLARPAQKTSARSAARFLRQRVEVPAEARLSPRVEVEAPHAGVIVRPPRAGSRSHRGPVSRGPLRVRREGLVVPLLAANRAREAGLRA